MITRYSQHSRFISAYCQTHKHTHKQINRSPQLQGLGRIRHRRRVRRCLAHFTGAPAGQTSRQSERTRRFYMGRGIDLGSARHDRSTSEDQFSLELEDRNDQWRVPISLFSIIPLDSTHIWRHAHTHICACQHIVFHTSVAESEIIRVFEDARLASLAFEPAAIRRS